MNVAASSRRTKNASADEPLALDAGRIVSRNTRASPPRSAVFTRATRAPEPRSRSTAFARAIGRCAVSTAEHTVACGLAGTWYSSRMTFATCAASSVQATHPSDHRSSAVSDADAPEASVDRPRPPSALRPSPSPSIVFSRSIVFSTLLLLLAFPSIAFAFAASRSTRLANLSSDGSAPRAASSYARIAAAPTASRTASARFPSPPGVVGGHPNFFNANGAASAAYTSASLAGSLGDAVASNARNTRNIGSVSNTSFVVASDTRFDARLCRVSADPLRLRVFASHGAKRSDEGSNAFAASGSSSSSNAPGGAATKFVSGFTARATYVACACMTCSRRPSSHIARTLRAACPVARSVWSSPATRAEGTRLISCASERIARATFAARRNS